MTNDFANIGAEPVTQISKPIPILAQPETVDTIPTAITSIKRRFNYLSVDICDNTSPGHPSIIHQQHNKVDDHQAYQFAHALDCVAEDWASVRSIDDDPEFAAAVKQMHRALGAISSTSVMISNGRDLLVERPGVEVPGRHKEISAFCDIIEADPSKFSPAQRIVHARLALVGVAPLSFEVINYADTSQIPRVLGRMLSRLDENTADRPCEKMGAFAALNNFVAIEQRMLEAKDLVRVTVPIGTRPRVYVPAEAVAPDDKTYAAAKEALGGGANHLDSMLRFMELVWRDFADEAFVSIQKDKLVMTWALVAGNCYYYPAFVENGKVVSDATPAFIGGAGAYLPADWRRAADKLSFENATPRVESMRRAVIAFEALPPAERSQQGDAPHIVQAVKQLLSRQVNHNMTKVLDGRMGRVAVTEWSPNMSRDNQNRVHNAAHTMGGVEDMFRAPLEAGGPLSQFRCWRELANYSFGDTRTFVAYTKAVDEYMRGELAQGRNGVPAAWAALG